jgi:hypothetical protein
MENIKMPTVSVTPITVMGSKGEGKAEYTKASAMQPMIKKDTSPGPSKVGPSQTRAHFLPQPKKNIPVLAQKGKKVANNIHIGHNEAMKTPATIIKGNLQLASGQRKEGMGGPLPQKVPIVFSKAAPPRKPETAESGAKRSITPAKH